jgi:formylglycine-generating enzyme required for sulfatase activity
MMELVRPQSPACGMSRAAEFAWGDELTPGGSQMENTWQGAFPYESLRDDGYERTSPVTAFPANGRYRPAARHPEPVDTSTCHVGFRCIIRQAGAAP